MTTDVAAICAGLTKARRKAVTGPKSVEGVWFNLRGSRAGGAFSRMCVRLADAGLVDRHGPHALTALGLAVRAALQQNDEGVLTPPTPNKDEAR